MVAGWWWRAGRRAFCGHRRRKYGRFWPLRRPESGQKRLGGAGNGRFCASIGALTGRQDGKHPRAGPPSVLGAV